MAGSGQGRGDNDVSRRSGGLRVKFYQRGFNKNSDNVQFCSVVVLLSRRLWGISSALVLSFVELKSNANTVCKFKDKIMDKF